MSQASEKAGSDNATNVRRRHRDECRVRFENLLATLHAQAEFLKIAKCPRTLAEDHARLINYLSSLDLADIQKIISRSKSEITELLTTCVSDEEIKNMALDEIERLLRQGKPNRMLLERIASIKFFVTRGDLSTTRNRDALINRLLGLVENERTRLTIQKIAAGAS